MSKRRKDDDGDDKDQMKGFIRTAAHHPNEKESDDMVVEQSGHVWDQHDGAELAKINRELAELKPQYEQSLEQAQNLQKKKSSTDTHKKLSKGRQDTDNAVPLSAWFRLDLFKAGLAMLLGMLAIALGMFGVHANLLASGEPVFLESPMMSWLFSGFLPGFSMAIKMVTLFLPSDRARRHYSLTIFALTGIVGVAWAILFALQFQGAVGAGIDWSDLATASGHGNWPLTLTQLLGEVLIGASSFLAVERIATQYSAGYTTVENLEYVQLDGHSKRQKSEHTPLAQRVGELEGRQIKLTASRKAYIKRNLLELRDLRRRLNALNNPDFKL